MRIALSILILVLSGVGFQEGMAQRIIGLVEVPTLYPGLNPGDPKGPVPLFVEPSSDAQLAVIVRNWRMLEYREHGYEKPSAVVFDMRHIPKAGTWYQVRYVDSARSILGWLSPADAGKFRSIYETLHGHLAYLTNEWDNRLFEQPNHDSAFTRYEGLGEHPNVVVSAMESTSQNTWLLIVLQEGNICTGGTRRVIAAGWVPAHSVSGGLVVWFYSRGC